MVHKLNKANSLFHFDFPIFGGVVTSGHINDLPTASYMNITTPVHPFYVTFMIKGEEEENGNYCFMFSNSGLIYFTI